MSGTLHAASATIALLIFDSPTRRSLNTIGTSTTRKPARTARYVVSIWKAYPRALTVSSRIDSRTSARKHLKPPVRSCRSSPSQVRAYVLPHREIALRRAPQSPIPPPST